MLEGRGGRLVLAGLAFSGAVVAILWGPLAGTGRRPLVRSLFAAAGLAVSLVPAAWVLGASPAAAAAAGFDLAAFLCFLGALAILLSAAGLPDPGSMLLAAAVGTLCVASFHLGNPFLEWGGPGRPSSAATRALYLVNPVSGAIGGALTVDWLRLPIMYRGFPGSPGGGLSVAQYYTACYPAWWTTLLLFGSAAGLCLAGRWALRFRRRGPAQTPRSGRRAGGDPRL